MIGGGWARRRRPAIHCFSEMEGWLLQVSEVEHLFVWGAGNSQSQTPPEMILPEARSHSNSK